MSTSRTRRLAAHPAPRLARLARPVAAALLGAALLAGCSGTADPQPEQPANPQVQQPDRQQTGGPGEQARSGLPAVPARWEQASVADVVVPAPMRELSAEEYGQVTAAAFNAGDRATARQIAEWVRGANTDLDWELRRSRDGITMRGTDPDRAGEVAVDVLETEAGVLVRAIDPGPALQR